MLRHSLAGSLWLLAAQATLLPGAPASAKVVHVDITKLAFQPASVAANVGDIIEWTNHDPFIHTATADDKAWEVVIRPGTTASRVLDPAGQAAYYCRFHPNMRGEVDVAP